jgi:cytidine deaminase
MNEEIKQSLLNWESMGKNYSPTFNWTELNEIAIKSGNKPFNLGCGDCRKQLLEYLLATIKDGISKQS